jgi:DNA-directed RNA polymerase I, II, and III subunit RPABC2
MTSDSLSKYELARLLGARATQIAEGSPVGVDADGLTEPLMLAAKELREGKLSATIRRYLPNGTVVDVDLRDLILVPLQ